MKPEYFDYLSVAREGRIPEDRVRELVEVLYDFYRGDGMLAELHVLRTCKVVAEGRLTIGQAIKEWREEAALADEEDS
jgi:hypothetical protein